MFIDAQIVKFDEKSEATITCPVYAVPGAEVTWEKQDGSLPDDAVTSRNKLLLAGFFLFIAFLRSPLMVLKKSISHIYFQKIFFLPINYILYN